ncbi:hypothetical protein CFH99_21790 [Nocardioides aromaticivorans]|uniref:Uncharacterized protein n=1 Tax=Nocardioides aromaticivorans TaxID=200618 RepID=A0ABX7PQH8_9ACTN|nr:hypothetical protein [Nocardioides aromaticivorans]QSR28259.1 hypothetical protein CFH99_21790 [Nocardioides aromaticivorans]
MKIARALVPAVLVALAVPASVGAAAADPVPDDPRQEQSITFQTTAPVGQDWVHTNDFGDYVPYASATSGLLVEFSVDPASTACHATPGVFGDIETPGRITVWVTAPGTCIVHADQAGDEEFQPAPRQTQTFDVLREPVQLTAPKVAKGLLGLVPTTFRAELLHQVPFGPGYLTTGYPGQTLTFSVAGKVMCSGVTVEHEGPGPFESTAIATCKATIGLATALSTNGYTVTYTGNELSVPASAVGKLS